MGGGGRPVPVGGEGRPRTAGHGRAVPTPSGTEQTLRRLLVDLVEEYARHTGQADLLRESVDGRVGEDPPGTPYPYVVT